MECDFLSPFRGERPPGRGALPLTSVNGAPVVPVA